MNKLVYGIIIGLFTISFASTSSQMAGMDHSKMNMPTVATKNQKMVEKTVTADKATNMVICPVTKAKISPDKAYDKTTYKGKTYYFCCAGCRPLFEKNPEKYLKSTK